MTLYIVQLRYIGRASASIDNEEFGWILFNRILVFYVEKHFRMMLHRTDRNRRSAMYPALYSFQGLENRDLRPRHARISLKTSPPLMLK